MEDVTGEEVQNVEGSEGAEASEKPAGGETLETGEEIQEDDASEGDEDGVEGGEPDKPETVTEEDVEKELAGEIDEKISSGRVNFADLKKEYPDVIKKYPALRDVIFRDAGFSKIFPSVEEAKEASEKVEAYDFLDASMAKGRVDILLNAMSDKQNATFAENVLRALGNKSRDLLVTATTPMISHMLNEMVAESKKTGNENLEKAARILNKFLYGTLEIQPVGRRRDPAIEAREKELEEKERALTSKQEQEYISVRDDITFKKLHEMIDKRLSKDIEGDTREAIITDIIDKVGSKLATDEFHMQSMRSLYRKAAKMGFPRSFIAQQVNAYLGRATGVIGTLVQKYRSGKMSSSSGGSRASVDRQVPNSAPSGKQRIDPKKIDWSKTSTEDLFNDKVHLRK